MITAVQTGKLESRTSGLIGEERFVVFASSLGTMFEWYDFYLYGTLAPVFAALFFPAWKRHRGAAVGLRGLCRGLPGAPVRGVAVRPPRRHRRAANTRSSSPSWSWAARPSWSACCRPMPRSDGSLRCCWWCCGCSRASRSAVNTAVPRPMSRSTPRRRPRLCHELDPDDGDDRLLPVARRDRPVPRPTWRGAFAAWGWRVPFLVSVVLLAVLGLHPAEAQRVTDLRAHEGGGEGLEGAVDRQLLALSQRQVRAARPVRRRGRPGVVWYTGQFYALFFLTITLKVDLLTPTC